MLKRRFKPQATVKVNRLAVALLSLRTDPPLALIVTFVAGLVVLGLLTNLLYDLLTGLGKTEYNLLAVAVAVAILVGIASLSFNAYLGRLDSQMKISETSTVKPLSYIITPLSPYQLQGERGSNLENILRLIQHHQLRLQELHIVSVLEKRGDEVVAVNPNYKENSGVLEAYRKLIAWIDQNAEAHPIIHLHPINDPNSAQDAFRVVSELLIAFSANAKIDTDEVVVDVTAGTKAMSVGMAAAALTHSYKLSYQATKRGPDGQPDFNAESRDTSMVYLEVDQTFRLKD